MKKEQKNHRLLALVACTGSLLMLPMQSFNFSTPSSKAVAQQPANPSQQQLQNIAKSITVKVISGQKGGSAIKDYTEALRFRQTYVQAYLNRGYAYAKKGKKQESLQDFDKALSLQPEDSWTYVNRGYARFILKDSKGAIEDFDKAIKIAPELAYLFYQDRASARDKQEDYQGAVEDYSQAISLSLKADKEVLAQLYYLRGHVRYNQKSYEEAINDFNVAIQLDGDNVDAYGFRGLANQALNNKQKAIEDYQKAAQIFRKQNNMESYNDTLTLIRQVQQEVVKN